MLCAGCGSHHCRTKSNIAEEKLQNYNFYAAPLILCTLTNSAQNSVRAQSQNFDIPKYAYHGRFIIHWYDLLCHRMTG